MRSNVIIVSSRVVIRIIFLTIEVVLDLLLLLIVRLTIIVSFSVRLELFRVAISRTSLLIRLY